ncbi:MAG: isopenicillin N synthase family dioxygenase [Oligoflexia bacterium]
MKILQVKYTAADAPRRFAESLKNTGFAVLSDHPIPHELIHEVFTDWARFFASKDKWNYRFDPGKQDGYFPFRSENAKDFSTKDLKEFFHLYPRTALPAGMSAKTLDMYDRLHTLASELLGWIEQESPEEIRSQFSMPLPQMIDQSEATLLRAIHYPPLQGDEEQGAVRAAAHGDINLITLLPAATAQGLQVKDSDGNWIDVPCDPGSLAINAGDMLQMASGGYYASTLHRVVNPAGEESLRSRFSLPLFLHPRPEVQLSSTHTAGSYLNERLVEIGLVKKEN